MKRLCTIAAAVVLLAVDSKPAAGQLDYLTWSAQQAATLGKAAYVQGRVGGLLDARLFKTERASNYKLAATWMTPTVIRASARLIQIAERLSDEKTSALVADAERENGTVVMVEIDPREGSGVIPNDWAAFLQPVTDGKPGRPVRGENLPRLREIRALAGVLRRNYDYDRFWVLFPRAHEDGAAALPVSFSEAQLIIRIYDREGTVRWPAALMRR